MIKELGAMIRTPKQTQFVETPTLRSMNAGLIEKVSSWRRLESCPACKANRLNQDFATIRHIAFSRCRACGFTFANPLPSEDVLSEHYNSDFYSNYRRLETLRIEREPYFSISAPAETCHRVAKLLGDDKTISVLDFGCGPGSFMAMLRDVYGFTNIEGLEINRESVDIARERYNLDISLTRDDLRHQQYDAVILTEVIEHIPDPDDFFQLVAGFVRPGGRVVVVTPSVDNFACRFLPQLGLHYVAPSHISLFTSTALRRLLNRFGFRVETLEIDRHPSIAWSLAASALYDLDFLSPQHEEDIWDCLYTPNQLGRRLGLTPARWINTSTPVGLALRVAYKLDHKLLARLPGIPEEDHLLAVAQKVS